MWLKTVLVSRHIAQTKKFTLFYIETCKVVQGKNLFIFVANIVKIDYRALSIRKTLKYVLGAYL